MKKNAAFILLAAAFVTGCGDIIHEKRGTGLEQFTEGPVTIGWTGDKSQGVQSYQADIHVYSMNNRTDAHASLDQVYRLAVRNISNRTVTRIDFDFGDDVPFRSFLSDGEEFIAFNPDTEEIGYRITAEDANSPLNRLFENQSTLSRINLPHMREEARRLSLDLAEESEGDSRRLLLEIPPALIPQSGPDRIIRSRAVFDLNNETLSETEVLIIREDGTSVTTTATNIYEDLDGVPIKIGTVTVIDSRAPKLATGIDSETPVFNSLDDIPELSASELAAMEAAGNIFESTGMLFGDPADLGFIETIYEVHQGIEINSAPEHLFRLILQ